MFAIENNEMLDAMMLFAELEGIDIDPEAGIATAALMRAVAEGSIERDRRVFAQRDRRRTRRPARETRDARPALVLRSRRGCGRRNDAVDRCSFRRACNRGVAARVSVYSTKSGLAGAGASRPGHSTRTASNGGAPPYVIKA